MKSLCLSSGSVRKPNLPVWGLRWLFSLKLTVMVRLGNRTIGVNLAIFDNIFSQIRVDVEETPKQKPPTGLRFMKRRFSTKIASLRDSRGF